MVLALVLSPLVLAAALCLLPDALNLQFRLATTFEPGGQNVSYIQSPTPGAPQKRLPPAPTDVPQPYSPWITTALHLMFGLLTLLATLLTLCALNRVQSETRASSVVAETFEVYRRAIRLTPGFLWVTFLQLLAPALGLLLYQAGVMFMPNSMTVAMYMFLVMMIIVGAVIYLWLYFAQYALIFGGQHSFHALLYSRDLVRKRFFKVASRVVVFLAVWSGYNSWAAGTFVVVSLLFGPVGVVTGTVGSTIFLVDLFSISVSFATTAFFVTAGLRLFQDLISSRAQNQLDSAAQVAAMQPTAVLPNVSAQA